MDVTLGAFLNVKEHSSNNLDVFTHVKFAPMTIALIDLIGMTVTKMTEDVQTKTIVVVRKEDTIVADVDVIVRNKTNQNLKNIVDVDVVSELDSANRIGGQNFDRQIHNKRGNSFFYFL